MQISMPKRGHKILPFYNGGFKRKNFATKDIDAISIYEEYFIPKNLISRMLKNRCKWCFKCSKNIKVHHVRKLKSLSGMKN